MKLFDKIKKFFAPKEAPYNWGASIQHLQTYVDKRLEHDQKKICELIDHHNMAKDRIIDLERVNRISYELVDIHEKELNEVERRCVAHANEREKKWNDYVMTIELDLKAKIDKQAAFFSDQLQGIEETYRISMCFMQEKVAKIEKKLKPKKTKVKK